MRMRLARSLGWVGLGWGGEGRGGISQCPDSMPRSSSGWNKQIADLSTGRWKSGLQLFPPNNKRCIMMEISKLAVMVFVVSLAI